MNLKKAGLIGLLALATSFNLISINAQQNKSIEETHKKCIEDVLFFNDSETNDHFVMQVKWRPQSNYDRIVIYYVDAVIDGKEIEKYMGDDTAMGYLNVLKTGEFQMYYNKEKNMDNIPFKDLLGKKYNITQFNNETRETIDKKTGYFPKQEELNALPDFQVEIRK